MKLFFRRAWKWLIVNFIAYFRFMLILILTAIMVYLFSLIPDITIKIYYVIGIFLIGVIILSTMYIKDLSQYDEKIRLFENIAQDLKLQYLIREVIFDDETVNNNSAISSITRKIQNKMEERYQQYQIVIKSNKWVPSFEDINFKFNGKKPVDPIKPAIAKPIIKKEAPLSETEIETLTARPPLHYNHKKGVDDFIYILKFFVPLNLQKTESKEFEVSYRTKAYEDALAGKIDFVSVDINHVSERLSFQILLVGKAREKYRIKQCDEIDPLPHMGSLCFQITDSSNQRMILSEKELQNNHIIPFYSDYKMEWTILNPKMGYKYKVYFTLDEKIGK